MRYGSEVVHPDGRPLRHLPHRLPCESWEVLARACCAGRQIWTLFTRMSRVEPPHIVSPFEPELKMLTNCTHWRGVFLFALFFRLRLAASLPRLRRTSGPRRSREAAK